MTPRTRLAAALLAVAVGFGGWIVFRPRADSHGSRSLSVRGADRTAPSLAVKPHRLPTDPNAPPADSAPSTAASSGDDTSQVPAPDDPPPPEVYVQPDAPPPKPKPALRIHVVTPWGDLPYREQGGACITHEQRWEVTSPDDEGGGHNTLWGGIDADGNGEMDAAALSRWQSNGWAFKVQGPSCKDVVLSTPPRPLPETLTITMEAEGRVTHFRGRVRDDHGRPVADAGVFVLDRKDWPGARTDAIGAFDLPVPLDDGAFYLPLGDGATSEDETFAILAVAPGFLAESRSVRRSGDEGIEIDLHRDEVDARLELTLRQSDGSPARGARAWLFAPDKAWMKTLGWESERPTPPMSASTTRRFLPRVAGGQSAEEQGVEIIQSESDGPVLHDLIADERGVIVVPAILPGRYHLRAAQAEDVGEHPDLMGAGDFHVRQTLDTTLEIAPPPATTRTTLHLQGGRTLTGRIQVAVNPGWHCEHVEHRHYVRIDDWAWSELERQVREFRRRTARRR